MARRYVNPHRAVRAFRPQLDLSPYGRLALAELLAETAARAGTGVPAPGTRPILAVLAGLAASAAGDGAIEAPADLGEVQARALQDCLKAAAGRAAAASHPAAGALVALRDEWGRFAGLKPVLDPLPVGSW